MYLSWRFTSSILIDIGQLGKVQPYSQTRSHLSGVPIDGVFTAEDQVHRPFLLELLDGLSQDIGGGQGIGAGKGPVGEQYGPIRSHAQGFSKDRLCLRGSHGNSRYPTPQLLFELDRCFQGMGVKGVHNGGDPGPDQTAGLGIDAHFRGVRHLFYAYHHLQQRNSL